MKNLLSLFVFFLFSFAVQAKAPNVTSPFVNGESLVFRVAFSSALTGNLTAGEATLTVSPDKKTIGNKSYYQVVAEGGTVGFFEFFYKIEERFESLIDDKANLPFKFTQKTRENNYRKTEVVVFNHDKQFAESTKKKVKIDADTHDVLSAFYSARMHDISKMKEGDNFEVPYFYDDSVSVSKIVYFGKQRIKTKMGTFNCMVFKPLMLTGRLFEQSYPITLWITDDANRIPVLIESKLAVGKARIELLKYNSGK